MHSSSGAKAGVGQGRAQLRVRCNPADDSESREPGRGRRLAQRAATSARTIARWYEAARSALPALGLVRPEVANRVQQRGLQPREGEVEPGHARDGKVEGGGITVGGEPIDHHAARIAEAEQLGALVECFARGIVARRAELAPTSPRSRTASRSVCPPLARRQVKGGSTGSGSR